MDPPSASTTLPLNPRTRQDVSYREEQRASATHIGYRRGLHNMSDVQMQAISIVNRSGCLTYFNRVSGYRSHQGQGNKATI